MLDEKDNHVSILEVSHFNGMLPKFTLVFRPVNGYRRNI